jgi:hypothetical protein
MSNQIKKGPATPETTPPGAPLSEVEQLRKENDALRSRLDSRGKTDTAVREKMSVGLDQSQAEAAVRNQEKYNDIKAARNANG